MANRVSEIQTIVPEARWRHVEGSDNPADCASRGMSPSELLQHGLWWEGPPWMQKTMEQQKDWVAPDGEMVPEFRVRAHVVQQEDAEPELLGRYSGLQRLLRITAWCRR